MIQTVKATLNGSEYTLTWNPSTERYEGTINAPSLSSVNQTNGYYPVTVTATDTAGNTATDSGATNENLRLFVKETVKPIINVISPSNGAYIINNRPVFKFTATDNDSGIDTKSLIISIDGEQISYSSEELTSSVVNGVYTFNYTPNNAIADGQHTVSVTVKDKDGNISDSAGSTFKIDTVAPALNISSPTENLTTNQSTVTLEGTTNDETSSPVTIAATLDGADIGAITVQSGGVFSKEIAGISDGEHMLIIVATDSAGKSTTVTRSFTINTVAPNITAWIDPKNVTAGGTVTIYATVTEGI